MIIAGVDTETTGFSEASQVCEVGYCIYDTTANFPLAYGSDLLLTTVWDKDAEAVHGISREATRVAALKASDINIEERILAYKPELIVAHNAIFDYNKIKPLWPKLCEVEWLCTQHDLDHTKFTRTKNARVKLMYLAIEYGMPVHGWHRAMTDAEYCCRIAARHDLKEALKYKHTPKYEIFTAGAYNAKANNVLNNLGFRWLKDYKMWNKRDLLDADVAEISRVIKETVRDWPITVEQQLSPEY